MPCMFFYLGYAKTNLSSPVCLGGLCCKMLHFLQVTEERVWEPAELWQDKWTRGKDPKRGHLSRWNFAWTWFCSSHLSLQASLLLWSPFLQDSLWETPTLKCEKYSFTLTLGPVPSVVKPLHQKNSCLTGQVRLSSFKMNSILYFYSGQHRFVSFLSLFGGGVGLHLFRSISHLYIMHVCNLTTTSAYQQMA